MQDHKQPFDPFMLITGIVIGLIAGVVLLASIDSLESRGEIELDSPEVRAEIAARLTPVGHAVLAGDEALTAPALASPAATAARAPLTGPEVYQQACAACHAPEAPAVLGAPKIDDAAAWAPRIAQGMAVLTQNAIDGVQGESGVMPAKGGRMDLTDEEVIAAIEYMADRASTQ